MNICLLKMPSQRTSTHIMGQLYIFLLFISTVHIGLSDDTFVTKTVYGFLDFTTTIENTVMVFSPQSAPQLDLNPKIDLPVKIIQTKPEKTQINEADIKPTKITVSTVNPISSNSNTNSKLSVEKSAASSEVVAQNTNKSKEKEPPVYHVNNVVQPEYDLLSRQPVEYVEETYRLFNLHNGSRSHANNRPADSLPKRGKVHIEGSHHHAEPDIHDIGSSRGKFVVSESSAHSFKAKHQKIRPSPSLRVLKTAAPVTHKPSINAKTSSRQSNLSKNFRSKNPNSTGSELTHTSETSVEHVTPSKKRPSRNKGKRRHKNATVSTQKSLKTESSGRRSSRLKVQPSSTDSNIALSTLSTFKLNRSPGRWQYKTSPKPRVAIRKFSVENGPSDPTSHSNVSVQTTEQLSNDNSMQNFVLDQSDLEGLGSQNGAIVNNIDQDNNKQKLLVETLNVEISTPANFKDTYYEIATIKTPYSFQAGLLKTTRYITITSTFEKVLEPESSAPRVNGGPLTENILFSSTRTYEDSSVDSSATTLSTLYLSDNAETPSLETVTESFNITHIKIKTQILPVVRERENNTIFLTLLQTYDITSLITATKTLSPLETRQFIPSKSFTDFGGILDEAGSEINLDLEFGDRDNVEELNENNKDYTELKLNDAKAHKNVATLDSSPINNQNLNADDLRKAVLLNLFNPSGQLSTVITSSYPVIKLDTVWESHIIPIVNGLSTAYRTLSKSIGVVSKTEYFIDTKTLSLPPIAPQLSVNPYILPAQQFQTITSPMLQQATITETRSKILKLTFGAKTAYTTIFSTEVVPTIVTNFVTTSIPVAATPAFPGFYPPPYPPYPYAG